MLYQITFLVQDEQEKTTITQAIESIGGKILQERPLGRRKLAYPIDKVGEAVYHTYQFELPSDNVSQLEHKLKFQEKILRFLIVRIETIIQPQAVPEHRTVDAIAAVPTTKPKAAPRPTKKTPKPAPTKPEASEQERIKALEAKLEELLKE